MVTVTEVPSSSSANESDSDRQILSTMEQPVAVEGQEAAQAQVWSPFTQNTDMWLTLSRVELKSKQKKYNNLF
jgi:hypothetical protein